MLGNSHAGYCEQVGVLVMVDAARLAPYVPPGFPIATFLGRSPVMVTGGRCEGTVKGGPAPPKAFGLVRARTDPGPVRLAAGGDPGR